MANPFKVSLVTVRFMFEFDPCALMIHILIRRPICLSYRWMWKIWWITGFYRWGTQSSLSEGISQRFMWHKNGSSWTPRPDQTVLSNQSTSEYTSSTWSWLQRQFHKCSHPLLIEIFQWYDKVVACLKQLILLSSNHQTT